MVDEPVGIPSLATCIERWRFNVDRPSGQPDAILAQVAAWARGPSNAYAAHHDAAVNLASSGTTLLSLNLAPGSYVVTAKAQIDTMQMCVGIPCQLKQFPTCTLSAGSDADTVSQGTEGTENGGGSDVDRMAAAMSLVVVHSSTTSFAASFVCADGLSDLGPTGAVATYSKIVTIKVGSITNIAE